MQREPNHDDDDDVDDDLHIIKSSRTQTSYITRCSTAGRAARQRSVTVH